MERKVRTATERYLPLRIRARASDPLPERPLAVCVVAASCFVGCLTGASDWHVAFGAPDADPVEVRGVIGGELLAPTVLAAMLLAAVAIVSAWRARRVRRVEVELEVERLRLRATRDARTARSRMDADTTGPGERIDLGQADRDAIEFHAPLERLLALAPAASALAVAAFLGGVACAAREAVEEARHPLVATPSEGTIVVVEGTVDTMPVERGFATDVLARHFDKPSRHRFAVRHADIVDDDGERVPIGGPDEMRIAVSVGEGLPRVRVGDRIRATGLLRGARGDPLPRDVDPRRIAARSGVVASLSVDSPSLVRRIEPDPDDPRTEGPFSRDLARIRETVRARLREALLSGVPDQSPPVVRPMLVALVLGDSEDGYRPVESAFRSVGLAHILAISGFNLAVLGWVVGAMARLATSDRRVHAVAVGGAALGALVLMAPAASAMRSAVMALVGATGAVADRDWNGDAILAAAALTLLAS
ncbi:MAG: hypothetical protein RIS86_535, partial [Planctomycetota bacterium]